MNTPFRFALFKLAGPLLRSADSSAMKAIFRVNNFDLIRLVAALQVALHHTLSHLKVETADLSPLLFFTRLFPGVPVFFFVSGFLISKSFESNPNLTEYAQNRILRIFPALIVCTFLSLVAVCLTGYFSDVRPGLGQIIVFAAGQVTLAQLYNPDFMRGFGTGVLNGSLWTITVELQFYIAIPILYWFLGLFRRKNINGSLFCLILLFAGISVMHAWLKDEYERELLFKLWKVSFAPWFYMFLLGVFFQRNFGLAYRFLSNRLPHAILLYMTVAIAANHYWGWTLANEINPLLSLILASLIFSLAYSFPETAHRLLRRNDISYGTYIYHMPVVNLFVYFGLLHNTRYAWAALTLTIVLAAASWVLIEKPAMALKKHPLNPLGKTRRDQAA